MSRAENLDTAPEKRKPKESPRVSKPLSETRPEAGESSLRVKKEAWAATPAPEFLTRPEPVHEKAGPGADFQAEEEPATIRLTTEPASTGKASRRKSTPIASYAFYTVLFVATAVTSAAVVLVVM